MPTTGRRGLHAAPVARGLSVVRRVVRGIGGAPIGARALQTATIDIDRDVLAVPSVRRPAPLDSHGNLSRKPGERLATERKAIGAPAASYSSSTKLPSSANVISFDFGCASTFNS